MIGRPTLSHRPERTASSARSSNLAASLVQDAFPRRVPLESPAFAARFCEGPATVRPALPPSAGFRRSFAPRACAERARPRLDPSGSSPLGGRGQTPLVDFCNRSDPRAPLRTVRTSPTPRKVTRARSGCCPRRSGGTCEWRPAPSPFGVDAGSQPRSHGSGALRGRCPRAASLATIARREGFAPTRSARTPPVANPWEQRPEWPPFAEHPREVLLYGSAGLGLAFANRRH